MCLQAIGSGADECPQLIGRQPDGPATAVTVEGGLAYIGSGATVLVLDVSDPTAPHRVGRVEVETAVPRLVVEDDLVYVVAGFQGGTIVDVSDATLPVVTSRIDDTDDPYDRVNDAAAVDRIAFFAAGGDGLRVYDTADPEHPVEIASIEGIGDASNVAVISDFAYVMVGHALLIIDVSDPTEPEIVSTMPANYHYGGDMVAVGSTVFIAGQTGFQIVDVSDPAAPSVTGTLDWPLTFSIEDLAVWGDSAWVSDFNHRLRVIDISDPAAPHEVASLDPRPSGLDAMAERLFMADGSAGLRVFDVSVPAAPVEIGSFDTPDPIVSIAVDGARTVAMSLRGLRVFDTTDPTDPVEIGVYTRSTEWGAICADLVGDHVFVCDTFGYRVVVLDISNPSAVTPVAEIEAPYLKDLEVVPPYAYIQADTLSIVDVSDPTNPSRVSSTEGVGRYITVEHPYVYGTGWTEGLFVGLGILDVSDPVHPRIVGGAFSGDINCCSKAAVSDSWLYVLGYPSESGSLFVVDARDPTDPVVVSDTYFGAMTEITVSGSSGLLVVHGSIGAPLIELDLTNPPNPTVVGKSAVPGRPADITVDDGRWYVAEERTGFEVFELCHGGLQETAWLGIAAHTSGKNGSEWRTDAVVRNLGTVEADLEFTLHAGGVEHTWANTVAARAQAVFEDVVGMMGVEGKGALELRSSQPISVHGRIYTSNDNGTFGQYLEGAAPENGLIIGDVAWLHGLRQLGLLWRSNLSFTNTDPLVAATIRVTLYATGGVELASFDLGPIAPGEVVQELAPLANRADRPDIGWAMAKIEVVSGFGVLGSASVIDSRTNDPITVLMVRKK